MIDQIFVDLDDVCNHFTMHALRYMGCDCSIHDSDFPEGIGYNIHTAHNMLKNGKDDLTLVEFFGHLGHGVWFHLPERPECQWLLETCAELVGRENVFICTKSLPQPLHYSGKIAWIYNHLPEWICGQIDITGHKYTNAREGALLIDDSEGNVDKFRATRRGNALLVPRPWNRNTHVHSSWEYTALCLGEFFNTKLEMP